MLHKFNFLLLLLQKNAKRHLMVFVMSSVMIALLGTVLFISSSIQKDLSFTLKNQPDFTIQRFVAGKSLNTPKAWIDEFLNISGVKSAQGRLYATHYYESKEHHFMIVGLDLFDTQTSQAMQKLVEGIDINAFLEKKNMLIGSGVKEFFDTYHYFDYYIFRPPDRSREKVYIYGTIPKESALVSNDMILMNQESAAKILGVAPEYVTDIAVYVTKDQERDTVYEKLILSHFDARIIQKKDIAKHYENLFNYKGGVFLVLYTITLALFLLILYQRYSMIQNYDTKEIAILRTVGWSINHIVWLKLIENAIVSVTAYMSGIIFAYVYVFFFNAPLLREIFLGFNNLSNKSVSFSVTVDFSNLFLLFLLFVIPFLLAIIIPLWRLATAETSEVFR